jgi:hypothetical protein
VGWDDICVTVTGLLLGSWRAVRAKEPCRSSAVCLTDVHPHTEDPEVAQVLLPRLFPMCSDLCHQHILHAGKHVQTVTIVTT